MNEEQELERIEAGWKPARMAHRGRPTRDIVDMVYDDGLTPKEALEAERRARFKPIGFIGKDILAVQPDEYRQELARDFRAAIEALPPMPEEMDR